MYLLKFERYKVYCIGIWSVFQAPFSAADEPGSQIDKRRGSHLGYLQREFCNRRDINTVRERERKTEGNERNIKFIRYARD